MLQNSEPVLKLYASRILDIGHFYNGGSIIRLNATWANICCSSDYASLVKRQAQDVACVWKNYLSFCVVQFNVSKGREIRGKIAKLH